MVTLYTDTTRTSGDCLTVASDAVSRVAIYATTAEGTYGVGANAQVVVAIVCARLTLVDICRKGKILFRVVSKL